MQKETTVPPTWIKVFSWLFLVFLLMPLFAIWQIMDTGTQLGVSAFGLNLKGGEDPLIWMLAMDGVLFLAALTGLFIVTKRSFAYGFGIIYSLIAIGVTIPAHFAVGKWDGGVFSNVAIQYPLLIAFLGHLIRNRKRWKDGHRVRNASASPPLTSPGQPAP